MLNSVSLSTASWAEQVSLSVVVGGGEMTIMDFMWGLTKKVHFSLFCI